MKVFSRLILAIVVLTIATTAAAETKGFAVAAGAFSSDFTAQIRKDLWLGGEISQISLQGGVAFHSKTTFRIDADYHFIIKSGNGRFYPLAGIDFAFNSDHVKFGVNGGGGLNFMLTDSLAAFAEVKYIFGDWDGWGIIGGIYF